MSSPRFTTASRVAEVAASPSGRDALYRQGYPLGEGFTDNLSQYQTLEEAAGMGRLRNLPELLAELNQAASK